MKRNLLSLLLALVMACSLAVPAAAAEQTADARLAAVTAQVKKTLDLDTEDYPEFYGGLQEDILAPSWQLEWSGEEGSLSISATEEGKILSYYRYESSREIRTGTFAPAFPGGSREEARTAAEAFLHKVLGQGETYTMEDRGSDSLNTTVYRFRGEILLNGLPAGLIYSVAVGCADNVVTSFYRDDLNGTVMGGIPSPKAGITTDQARTALRGILSLRLEYALPEDGGKQAVLRYLPEATDEYYVDAATGKLINLTELARNVDKGENGVAFATTASGGAAEDAAAAPEVPLSDAEQAGVAKLEGVLNKEALDARVRGISALGLGAYTLSTVSYSVPREDQENAVVTASLRYGRQVNGSAWRRTVTVDAKTGELLRVYSSAWMPEEPVKRTVGAAAARETAEKFLAGQCAGQFAKTALYDSSDAMENDRSVSHSFTFAQKENGWFFPGNAIRVGVDATDGSISAYEKNFDDDVTFDSPEGILTGEQALEAWLNTYTVTLSYIQVPTAVDYSRPEYAPLQDWGVAYLYRLALGYSLKREDYLLGIDAKTGEPVEPAWAAEEAGIAYSDVSGHWAQGKIEALAQYGVGYLGGEFRPDSALTQLDLIALLASTEGYRYDSTQEGAADALYTFAYGLGLLRREDRKDDAVLTRSAAVRLILDAVGYGPVARLEGIFRTKFTDDKSIPAADYGYVALAQGLGMTSGSAGGAFRPNAAATRAQAAVMLCNLMAR